MHSRCLQSSTKDQIFSQTMTEQYRIKINGGLLLGITEIQN